MDTKFGGRTLSVSDPIAEMHAIREENEMRGIRLLARRFLDRDQTTYVAAGPPVDDDVRATAEATHEWVCGELGLKRRPPDLRWCRPLDDDELAYVDRRGEVGVEELFDGHRELFRVKQGACGAFFEKKTWPVCYVRNDLSLVETMRTVIHEAAHGAGADEDQAYAFEDEWAERLDLGSSHA